MSKFLFPIFHFLSEYFNKLPHYASFGLLLFVFPSHASAVQLNIIGPPGSSQFGKQVVALPNGNIVVIDPGFSSGTTSTVGAVYFYNSITGTLISRMTGSTEYDEIGSGGIIVLANGNFVVASSRWDNGPIYGAGAVTWCSKTTGCPASITPANSLVGASLNDYIGFKNDPGLPNANVTPLANGNYVVGSYLWDNGGSVDVGAVTFANGDGGTVGPVSTANSIIGSRSGDYVGRGQITALNNGNYVISSPDWSNGAIFNVGAATFGNGMTGITGVVSVSNSLIGSSADDHVGNSGVDARIIPLTNGNYVVRCELCDNGPIRDTGAVTFGNGTTGITGFVSAQNSLVGSTFNDRVGYGGVTALSNGNYVVNSYIWGNGGGLFYGFGAVTFGDGTEGTSGVVSSANSLVGSRDDDQVGRGGFGGGGGEGITALTNGNYVVNSPYWNNGNVTDAGASTFANGTTGISGTISSMNSLVGSIPYEAVSWAGTTGLANGNYVVCTPGWNNEAAVPVGAATFGNGVNGVVGQISVLNSLVGSTAGDAVCNNGATALTNGNYVVNSYLWDNGSITNAGAATLGNGKSGIIGQVSAANSLVGSSTNDRVGFKTTALSHGNYVVVSTLWNNGTAIGAGAVTFGNGALGIVGPVSADNSLIGSISNDSVGLGGVTALINGDYVVSSIIWRNGTIFNAGAITYAMPTTNGVISSENSVLGTTPFGGDILNFSFDYINDQLVVGRPADNIVTLLRPDLTAFAVKLSGRVLTSAGYGIRNARVVATDSQGTIRSAKTSSFGYYRFEDIQLGETYSISVSFKQHSFNPRTITVTEKLSNFDFIAILKSFK